MARQRRDALGDELSPDSFVKPQRGQSPHHADEIGHPALEARGLLENLERTKAMLKRLGPGT